MKYTDSHEWIKVSSGIGIVGITSFAKQELGDVVFLELPKMGRTVKAGEEACVLESTKSAADIYSPVSGEIVEINAALKENLNSLNHSPEHDGWLFKIKLSRPEELQDLLDEPTYKALIQS